MRKGTAVLGAAAVVALAGYILVARGVWNPMGAVAQAPSESGGRGAQTGAGRPAGVPVEVVNAARKKVPVRVDSLGTVTPMASVAIKTRLDSEIVGVHFSDGAMVKTG